MGLINNTVYLENNFTLWKKMYEEEKNILFKIFNQDNFTIEHVGSTAVKGLASKPIVDIAIGVENLNSIDKYMNVLKKLYTIKINKENNEILLIKENNNETFLLIHILPINSERYKNMIDFRDILINNLDIFKEYEKLKIKLSKLYPNDRKMYTKSKNNFINEIINQNTNN